MDASAHSPSTSKLKRQTLSRFRNGFGFFLQWLAVCLMVFQPVTGSRAVYVPDPSGNPSIWVPSSSADSVPSYSPDYSDADSNGIPDWQDAFQAALDAGQLAWWGGGNYLVDGQWYTFPAQYHWAAVGDSDGDGIPDDLDPYPNDATNNTFYWPGGSFYINNQWTQIPGNYYPSSISWWNQDSNHWVYFSNSFSAGLNGSIDSDGDGIPDMADPYPNDPNNGNTFYWTGGSYVINNQNVFFSSGTYPGIWSDHDGDGIPDSLDAYPDDANNNNSFYWAGGTYIINGVSTSFSGGTYLGIWSDRDGDGIPDSLDPYPDDSSNDSLWWGGGYYTVNGQSTYFAGQYIAGPWMDSDGDGIPDSLDPYPSDANNNNSFYWGGGTFLINGVQTTFNEGTYQGPWVDRDGDGIPDSVDPYPDDANNNTAWWQGGTFMVDGVSTTYAGQYHRADAGDADVDGIPDDLDPYPNDITNNSFWWSGGTFAINNQSITFLPQYYSGTFVDSNGNGIPDNVETISVHTYHWEGGTFALNGSYSTFAAQDYQALSDLDSDGDGIPDALDPWPNDPWNNSYFSLAGGDYYVNGVLTHFGSGYYGGVWSDRDGDGIPDVADPYPDDSSNNSFWWQGGTFFINGTPQFFASGYYAGNGTDSDGDGIPDGLDPYPDDVSNNTAWWQGGTFVIDGVTITYSGQYYAGNGTDSDSDGIPDAFDPYPNDASNNSAYWPGGYFTINDTSTWLPGRYHRADSPDSDGDGIPDDIDPYPNDPNNGGSVSYWAGGTFAIDGASVTFPAQYYAGASTDSDGDGIPDSLDPYPNDASNNSYSWGGGDYAINGVITHFDSGSYAGQWIDTDGDGIPDALDPYPSDPTNNSFSWGGGGILINGGAASFDAGYHPGVWMDSDGDGIPDVVDPYPNDANNGNFYYWPGGSYVVNNSLIQYMGGWYAVPFVDSDGDGIPDVVDPYPNDANNNTDVTADTDGDGMINTYELRNGLDPNDPHDAIGSALGDLVFNYEKAKRSKDITYFVSPEEYSIFTNGQSYADALANNDPNLSIDENDWDGDGISNYDEVFTFHTSPRDASSLPTYRQVLQAMMEGKCTVTTRLNYSYLIEYYNQDNYMDPTHNGNYMGPTLDNPVSLNDPNNPKNLPPQSATLVSLGSSGGKSQPQTDDYSTYNNSETILEGGTSDVDVASYLDWKAFIDAGGERYVDSNDLRSFSNNNGISLMALVGYDPLQMKRVMGWVRAEIIDDTMQQVPVTKKAIVNDAEVDVPVLDGNGNPTIVWQGSWRISLTLDLTYLWWGRDASQGNVSNPRFANLPSDGTLENAITSSDGTKGGRVTGFDNDRILDYLAINGYSSEDAMVGDADRNNQFGGGAADKVGNYSAAMYYIITNDRQPARQPLSMTLMHVHYNDDGTVQSVTPDTLTIGVGHKASLDVIYIPPHPYASGGGEDNVAQVELDIVHPVGGKLDKGAQHDPSKGGLVAVKRGDFTKPVRDEPVTQLVIRANTTISGLKWRLRFNSGVDFKLWQDLARTQAVVSEQTEFDPSQDVTLYFEGFKKSDSVGGESVKLLAVVNDNSIEADAAYFTVVEAQILVQIRFWIIEGWIDMPWHPTANLFMLNIAGGDRRHNSLDWEPGKGTPPLAAAPGYRVAQEVVLQPFKELNPSLYPGRRAGASENRSGISSIFLKSSSVPYPSQPYSATNELFATATPSAFASPSTSRMHVDSLRTNDRTAKVNFWGAANDPVVLGAFDIDWDLSVSIDATDPLDLKYTIEGSHDDYPAVEINMKLDAKDPAPTTTPFTTSPQPYSWEHRLPSNVWKLANGSWITISPPERGDVK